MFSNLRGFVLLVLVLTFAGSSRAATDAVAQWTFNEGSGTVAADASGNNNVLTFTGASFKDGLSGKSMTTYPSGSYARAASSASLSLLQDTMSIALWVYPQYVINVNGRIMSKKADWNTNSGFELNYNPYTKRLSFTGSGSTVAYADNIVLTKSTWHHVAVVATGTTVQIFVNGSEVTTKKNINKIVSNTLALFIGRQSGVNKNYYTGRIDECYLFARALTAGEIATLASPPNPNALPGHVGLWKFDGATVDSSGNGFNAVLKGATYSAGRFGQALRVDGTSYASIASTGTLSMLAGQLTMSVWVNPNFPADASDQVFGRIISKKNSWDETSGFELEYNPATKFIGVLGSGGTVAGWTVTLTNGKWYHLVATITGQTATLYVNNVSHGAQPVSPVTANNLQLAVGRISGEAYVQNNYFYGAIDDFHLFNRVLTAAEINTLYTTPYGGPTTSAVPTSTGGPFVVPTFDPSFVDKTQLTGFDTPLGLTAAADGRIFVWQKSGKVYVIQNGQRSLFADITPLVGDVGDHGLLSVALHPSFTTNGYIYFYYTVWPPSGQNTMDSWTYSRIVRYHANGNTVDMNSAKILLGKTQADGIPACSSTHTAGTLLFGHDGMLYASHGDGARFEFTDYGNDQQCGDLFGAIQNVGAYRAQDLNTLAGKIIRIDPSTGLGLNDNPFYRAGDSLDSPRSKIYALGMRNPFRMTLRPPLPGDNGNSVFYATDVGWDTWERLLVVSRGDNLGWPCYEGKSVNQPYQANNNYCGVKVTQNTMPGNLRMPLIVWHHGDPTRSSPPGFVGYAGTGVAFYQGNKYPIEYQNNGDQALSFFWCDYAGNWIKAGFVDRNDQLLGITDFYSIAAPVYLGSNTNAWDSDVHYISIYTGEVHTVFYESGPNPVCEIDVSDPSPGLAPATVQFWSDDSYDPLDRSISFQWNFGDGTTSTKPNPKKTYNSRGNYTATLTVRNNNGMCKATIKVSTWLASPTVTITTPADKTLYNAGDMIAPKATHSAGTTLFWDLQLWHNSHFHPQTDKANGANPVFQLAVDTEPGADRYSYRIVATATDAMGNTEQSTVSLFGRETKANGAPTINLMVRPQPAVPMRAVFFDATASSDPDGDLIEYTWTFGDGTPPRTTRAIGTTRHVYEKPGTYTLNVTAWETFGKTTTLLRDIVVGDGSLVAYWTFNENTGTTTADTTGNGANGDLEGGAGWAAGTDGTSALSLNAATQGAVKTKLSTALNQIQNTITISVWVYPTMATADTWHRIVSKKQYWDGADGFELEYNPNGAVVLLGSGGKLCAAWTPLPANAWSHIAAVGTGNTCKIFINGVDRTDAGATALDPIMPNNLQLTIGRFSGDQSSFFSGRIDNVRVYNIALTQAQITSLYNAKN